MGRQAIFIDAGTRFRSWTALESTSRRKILCRCDCGNEKIVFKENLIWGKAKGCKKCFVSPSMYKQGEENPNYLGENGNTVKKMAWLVEEKSNPCVDCGRQFPTHCMQFDHKTEDKSFEINASTITLRYTLEEMKAERAECELLCSNCHDHRTWCRSKGIKLYPIPDDCWHLQDGTIEQVLKDMSTRVE